MATVTYQAALLGLSHDLTKRKSPYEPVAIIGTAHAASSKSWHIFFLMPAAMEERRAIAADPVAASIVRQLPKMLTERIEAATSAGVEPRRLLDWLNAQMTDSLQFVWIKETEKHLAAAKQSDLIVATVKQFGKFFAIPKPKKAAAKSQARKSEPAEGYTTHFAPVPGHWRRRQRGCAEARP